MLPVNHVWKEGSMMDPIDTTPKLDLAIHAMAHVVAALHGYHTIDSPWCQRRELREAAHASLQGLLATVPRQAIEPMVLAVDVTRQSGGELGQRANGQAGVLVGSVRSQGSPVRARRWSVPPAWLSDA